MKFSTRIQAKLKSHNLNLVPARVTCRPTCSGLEGMATGDHLRAFAQLRSRGWRSSHYRIEVRTAANFRGRFERDIGDVWRSLIGKFGEVGASFGIKLRTHILLKLRCDFQDGLALIAPTYSPYCASADARHSLNDMPEVKHVGRKTDWRLHTVSANDCRVLLDAHGHLTTFLVRLCTRPKRQKQLARRQAASNS